MPRDNFFLGGEEGDGQAANRRRAEGGGAYAGRVRKRGRGRSNDRQREKRAFCVYVVLEALACLSTRLYAAVFVRAYSKRIGVSVSVCMCNVPPPLPFDQNQAPTSLKTPPSPHRLFDIQDSLDKVMHSLPQLLHFARLRNGFIVSAHRLPNITLLLLIVTL